MPAPAEPEEPSFFDKMTSSPAFKSAMRSAGTVVGREITRSIFGTGRRRAPLLAAAGSQPPPSLL